MSKLVTTLPFLLVIAAAPAHASPDLETVLNRHFEAQGGLARLKAVSGVSYVSTESFDGKTTTISGQKLRPNLWRSEINDGTSVVVKGFDGQTGWVQKDGAVEVMSAEKSAQMKARSTFDDALIDAASKGHKVTLAGVESVDGAQAFVIQLAMADGQSTQRRYIDTKSYLEVKRVVTGTYEGKPFEKNLKFTAWKTMNGITFPTVTEFERDGKKGTVTLTKIVYDAPLKATAFAAPAQSPRQAESAPVKAQAAR